MVFVQKAKIMLYSVCVTLIIIFFSEKGAAYQVASTSDSVVFTCQELLGRPAAYSIVLTLCTDKDIELYVEYGIIPSAYANQSAVYTIQAGIPATISITPLIPDMKYYYRVRYRTIGVMEYSARGEHTFHTARSSNSSFVFAIEADPHLDTATSPELYMKTLTNILDAGPDFLIDLGDTFMSDKLPVKTSQEVLARHLLLRSFFDTLCHSVPLMLVLGNHEGELGWLLNGTSNNLAVWATNIRKKYYPNPFPDGFYSGDTAQFNFVGVRQDYYAWEWGNTLFIVLDPYWNTTRKPTMSKNMWDWTLGRVQYDWFHKTLANSTAKFKFVFAHQIIGGIDTEGRGGIEAVPFYEMGGLDSTGLWAFAVNRPGWPKPIHQLMVDYRVCAFFHGHDHVYVKQELDGIVYQELPQPAYYNFANPTKSYSNSSQAALYGYTHGVILPSSGYLRVTVSDTTATVDYVRSYLPIHETNIRHNGEVSYSYVLKDSNTGLFVGQSEFSSDDFVLSQNYPNPFNSTTVISYQMPFLRGVGGSLVSIKVYDLLSREVAVLVQGIKQAGTYEVQWDASAFSSGIYFYRLMAGDRVLTQTMVLLK